MDRRKAWSIRNKESENLRKRKWARENPEKMKEYFLRWKNNNPEKAKEIVGLWREKNKDKIKSYSNKRTERVWTEEQIIASSLRRRLRSHIKSKGNSTRIKDNLGCDFDYLRKYIQSQYTDGMSWDNYGIHGWHIDHIKPLSSFDLTDANQISQACHYKNLQPLWANENLKKGSKLNWVKLST